MRTVFYLLLMVMFGASGQAIAAENMSRLTVDRAVSIALAGNIDLRLQQSEVEANRGSELGEHGAFDPRLEAGVLARRDWLDSLIIGPEEEKSIVWNIAARKKMVTGTEIGLFWENSRLESDSPLAVFDLAYTSAIGVTVSQPLLQGNSRVAQTAGIRAAEKVTAAVSFLADKQAADLAAEVKKAYWELVFARQDIEVKKLSLELARSLHAEISTKIENEVLARVEIYQPESEIARREESLIAAEKRIANTADELKLLMNSRDWQLDMVPVDTLEVSAELPDLREVLENVLDRRPDILAGDLEVDAAEIMAGKAEDDLKPYLALVGAAGLNGAGENLHDTVDTAVSDPSVSWQLGLSLQVPIGDRSARGSLIKARVELAKAKFRAELLRQRAEKSAREVVRDVTLAIKTIEASSKTSLAARKSLEAEEEKFRVGLSTANDVLESQDAYARSLAGEKRALIDLAKARAELDRVQGIISFRNEQQNDASAATEDFY